MTSCHPDVTLTLPSMSMPLFYKCIHLLVAKKCPNWIWSVKQLHMLQPWFYKKGKFIRLKVSQLILHNMVNFNPVLTVQKLNSDFVEWLASLLKYGPCSQCYFDTAAKVGTLRNQSVPDGLIASEWIWLSTKRLNVVVDSTSYSQFFWTVWISVKLNNAKTKCLEAILQCHSITLSLIGN